jgi:hypothetical protein
VGKQFVIRKPQHAPLLLVVCALKPECERFWLLDNGEHGRLKNIQLGSHGTQTPLIRDEQLIS